MSINNICLIRRNKDFDTLQQSDMSNDGIYFNINHQEKTLTTMIIGPKDTPYEGGFYFFDVSLTDRYPFKPPKVTFLTTDGKSRMNPNLYTNGKVCLSILGTWSGPTWTSCMSITTVLLALVTILNENPIQNEPGYENDVGYRCKDYNKFIEHENIRIAVLSNYNSNDDKIKYFKDIMKIKIEANLNIYLDKVLKLSQYNNSLIANIYSCNNVNDWKIFIEFFKTFKGYIKTNLIDNKKIRKCPGQKSNSLTVGYILKSEFDNNEYIVKLTKNGIKRWTLYKTKDFIKN